jgi:hypothetical protein
MQVRHWRGFAANFSEAAFVDDALGTGHLYEIPLSVHEGRPHRSNNRSATAHDKASCLRPKVPELTDSVDGGFQVVTLMDQCHPVAYLMIAEV